MNNADSMMKKILPLFILVAGIAPSLQSTLALAESKRVHVYQLSQRYYDVRPGQSLSEIAAILLPTDYKKQRMLMQDILRLNPNNFINGNPNRLLANKRLWLPNVIQQPINPQNSGNKGKREFYSWGNIRRADP